MLSQTPLCVDKSWKTQPLKSTLAKTGFERNFIRKYIGQQSPTTINSKLRAKANQGVRSTRNFQIYKLKEPEKT